jgi:hypothetical protein
LLLGNIGRSTHFLENLIEKLSKFIGIKTAGIIPVITRENLIDILLDLLVAHAH